MKEEDLQKMWIFSELLGVGQHVLQYRAERGGDGDQRALHLPRHGGRHPLQGRQQHQDHQSGRYRLYRSGFQKHFFLLKLPQCSPPEYLVSSRPTLRGTLSISTAPLQT